MLLRGLLRSYQVQRLSESQQQGIQNVSAYGQRNNSVDRVRKYNIEQCKSLLVSKIADGVDTGYLSFYICVKMESQR